jgi:RND family efflux transporter MFP subunit
MNVKHCIAIAWMAISLSAHANNQVALTTRVPGVVAEVVVSPGQHVKKGEALLRLDPTIYEARVKEMQAGVDRAQVDEADAKKDLDRQEELYRRTVTSTTELDAAKLRYAKTRADLDAAQARLTIATQNLADSVLRAPFSGVVSKRLAEPGVVTTDCQSKTLIILSK